MQIETSNNQKLRTRELEGAGQDPKWDEVFDLTVKNLNVDTIKMTVFDEDFGGTRDTIGETEIKMTELYDTTRQEPIDTWIVISFEGKEAGKVHLKGTFQPTAV